jgi:molecular chaperone GrpE
MPDTESSASEDEVYELEAPVEDPLIQIQAELEAIRAESNQWHDRFLRKAAELENFRKRVDKERVEMVLQAKSSVLLEFLPILDACERAMESFEDAEDLPQELEQYREGVQLLYKQLNNTLLRLGVVAVDAIGQKFDPYLHEAITREETSEYEENTVTRELRRGYIFQERLLRPAQVVVAVHTREHQDAVES